MSADLRFSFPYESRHEDIFFIGGPIASGLKKNNLTIESVKNIRFFCLRIYTLSLYINDCVNRRDLKGIVD